MSLQGNAGAILAAGGIAFFLVKSRANYMRLPLLPVRANEPPADVTVVIPARNEVRNIQRVVHSFSNAPVIVVDDHSNDGTGEAALTAGAMVMPAPPLPAGALGKPNACRTGADASRSEWILFADADTQYGPAFLPSLLSYARSENLAAVSAFLKQTCLTLPERMLLPYAFALYFCGVSARRVNGPASAESLANGQCFLFRRDAYDAVGGHAAVIGSVIEDVALARLLKQHRLRARVVRAEHLGDVRMYDGLASIWRGFQKNSFRFLRVNPWSGLQVIVASILITSYLPVFAWLVAQREWAAAIGFAMLPCILLRPWYGSWYGALLAPAAIYLFQLIALHAMLTTLLKRKAIWKGRRV